MDHHEHHTIVPPDAPAIATHDEPAQPEEAHEDRRKTYAVSSFALSVALATDKNLLAVLSEIEVKIKEEVAAAIAPLADHMHHVGKRLDVVYDALDHYNPTQHEDFVSEVRTIITQARADRLDDDYVYNVLRDIVENHTTVRIEVD